MPGIVIYLAMLKGLLDKDEEYFYHVLVEDLCSKGIQVEKESFERYQQLVQYFKVNPVKVAIVTSSIEYEANIVLRQSFKGIQEQIHHWEMS